MFSVHILLLSTSLMFAFLYIYIYIVVHCRILFGQNTSKWWSKGLPIINRPSNIWYTNLIRKQVHYVEYLCNSCNDVVCVCVCVCVSMFAHL